MINIIKRRNGRKQAVSIMLSVLWLLIIVTIATNVAVAIFVSIFVYITSLVLAITIRNFLVACEHMKGKSR